MKRKLLVALVLAVIVSLAVATPALAYTGVSGIVIDSKTLQPWTYGGEVWIVNNTTGDVEATCTLDGSGNIVDGGAGDGDGICEYGEDFLSVGVNTDATPPASGDQMEVIIDFSCAIFGCGSPPAGTPGLSSNPYTESVFPFLKGFGYIKTGTGPNAVVLADANTKSTAWLAVALAVVALVSAGGVVLLLRRRRVA